MISVRVYVYEKEENRAYIAVRNNKTPSFQNEKSVSATQPILLRNWNSFLSYFCISRNQARKGFFNINFLNL